MPHPLSRRHFLELSSLTGLGLLLAPLTSCRRAPAPATPVTQSFATLFANPPRPFQPKFRWWWPHGLVDPAQIRREIDIMADAGFGGAEIADVHHSIRKGLSPDTHGWGTEPWRAAVQAALEQAAKHGMSIDHSIGPSWPAASNLITPDSSSACKELATEIIGLDSGRAFNGALPQPDNSKNKATPVLQAVQAIKLAVGPQPKGKEYLALPDTLIDLLPLVSKNHLSWTPPDTGNWLILSYWLRGSAQQPEGGPHAEPEFYVVDHFSSAGTAAIVDLWKQKILTPSLTPLVKQVGGCLFEDSIEMETHETIWTPNFLEEFEKRRGYSLLPYLPLVVQKKEDPFIQYQDFDSKHILHDWWQTLSELFLEHHFEALKIWAHSLGLGFRGQPYGLKTDAVRAAATLDIAEGESLGFKNLDDYRSLAGGRDMGGHTILSNEAGAYPGAAYATTWKRILQTLNPHFAAGVNQTVLHGFAYADAPGAAWPGFAAFTPYGGRQGYSEAWGPRQPSWTHITDISGYFSRVHFLLQQGQPQIDVAFLRQKGYAGSGFGAPWFSKEGVSLGWTHEFISPSTLELPTATVRDKLLAPEGPAFQLLVFEGDAFHSKKTTFELPAARKLLSLAQAGLPILAIGDWTQPIPSGRPNEAETEQLKTTFDQLLNLDNVVMIPSRGYIEQGLEKLEVRPRISYQKATAQQPPSDIVHAERRTPNGRYFYFCNPSDIGQGTTVKIPLAGDVNYPHHLNLWTGSIDQMQGIEVTDNELSVPVPLAPHSSLAFCLTDLELSQKSRAINNSPGHLNNSLELTNWTLTLESWHPGNTASDTLKQIHSASMDLPTPWTQLEGFADLSGVGTYTCEFQASEELSTSSTVGLMWGTAFDTLRITVNGKKLPPCDPMRASANINGYLNQGSNTLQIETSSTLLNQLRITDPTVYGTSTPQLYGLTGPIKLVW